MKGLTLRLLLSVAALVLGLSSGSSVSEGAGPYAVPAVSYITATAPGSLFSDTHLACLSRSEQAGSAVTTSLVCYSAQKPSPPPPPPPPPYEPATDTVLVGSFSQSTGAVLLPFLACTEVFPGFFAVSITLDIQLDKAGGPATGSVVVTEDFTAPFDCADGTQTTGPLTLTPLPLDHDEDQDGCTDWEELGPNEVLGGRRDPFNFWDFYDPTRNGAIGFTDFLALVERSGAVDFNKTAQINRNTDPLSEPPPAPAYHPRFDRGGQIPGGNLWEALPANGSIGFSDFLSLIRQNRATCLLPP